MGYTLDIEQIEKDMINKNQFNHYSGQKIKILPFRPNYTESQYNFEAILGEISRLSIGKKEGKIINQDELFENILDEVDTDCQEVLIRFIKKLYFKEDGGIEPFHPKVFAYTKLDKEAKNDQKNIAQFLFDVFIREQSEEAFKKLYEAQGDVVVRLLTNALPKLEPYQGKGDKFCLHEPLVADVFNKDLSMLLKDEKRFIKWFRTLIHYYYFFYTSQTILKLNQRLQAKKEIIPTYYLVGDEKGGRERASSKQGFKLLKQANENTFANVMLCQFLNYNRESGVAYTFSQWKAAYVDGKTEEEIENIVEEIEKFIGWYKGQLANVPWDQLVYHTEKITDPLERVVQQAFEHIKYQFVKGGRLSAARKYENWFYKFATDYYTKSGGNLGLLLNIKEDLLLFMIGLTIQDQEKERLNVVFEELEKRGLFFDDYSKEYIVELLEKRNLLEKKSDSGDAKYVRAIL